MRVPMSDLRSALTDAGLGDVRSLLQSGNVVFEAGPKGRNDARLIEKVVSREFGVDITVILRTAKQLASIASSHPMAGTDESGSLFHVVFLDQKPSADAASRLDPDRFEPDWFSLSGQEVFVHYPNGQGRSKLTLDYFEKALGVRGTMRNMNTVGKLTELTKG